MVEYTNSLIFALSLEKNMGAKKSKLNPIAIAELSAKTKCKSIYSVFKVHINLSRKRRTSTVAQRISKRLSYRQTLCRWVWEDLQVSREYAILNVVLFIQGNSFLKEILKILRDSCSTFSMRIKMEPSSLRSSSWPYQVPKAEFTVITNWKNSHFERNTWRQTPLGIQTVRSWRRRFNHTFRNAWNRER